MSETEILQVIGSNIRDARLKARLTQECLAELTELHPQTVSNIERGRHPCSVVVFALIAQHLGVEADLLLAGLAPIDKRRAEKIRKALARKRRVKTAE